MHMQKFEADDMAGALEKVRRAMGEEAMIVRSRTVKRGGLFGLTRKERVEVCAALNPPAQEGKNGQNGQNGGEDRWEQTLTYTSGHIHDRLEMLNSKLDTLLLGLGAGTLRSPAEDSRSRGWLPAEKGPSDEDALRRLAAQMPLCGGLSLTEKPAVLALVGPTGVGKTTTLLKLAGQFSLRQGKKVTIVTADTFRLGAVEQLKAFSRVFRVGLQIVLSPEEMLEIPRKLGGEDLVLIDTPGGSQRDRLHQSQVEAFLQAAEPTETHLVLSATSRPSVIKECIAISPSLGADRLVFTKLDEAARLHEVLGAAFGTGIPLSYLGCGQKIPDDLEVATEERLAEVMLGTDSEEDD